MSIHPLHGRRLQVIRTERDRHGRQYVIAEHPQGFWLRLPLSWTEHGAPPPPPRIRGREVRLSIAGLVGLARAVRVLRDGKVDRAETDSILGARLESDCDANATASGPMVRAVTDGATGCDRRAGDALAQGLACERNPGRRGDS